MIAATEIELGEIMAERNGSVDPASFPDETFDLYSIPAFDSGRPEVLRGSEIGSTKQCVASNDVLLSKIVPHIRRAWIVGPEAGRRIIASSEWIVFRHRSVLPQYLRHVLVGDQFHKQFMGTVSGVGGSLLRARPAYVAKIKIALPPLAEQRRIAAILDAAEALRAKRRAALAKLDSLTQSIFLEMFGDPRTNPRAWPVVDFGEVVENLDSRRVPVKSSDRDGRKGQYPYYGASGIIDWVDDYLFDGTFLLIGEDGANLVAHSTPIAYMATGKIWVNNHAHIVACNGRADLRFLEFYIERLDLKPFISGTAQPKLNRSNLDRIPVMLPPLDLQQDFHHRVVKAESIRSIQVASATQIGSLFGSLQHRAFRGEL